MSSFQSYSVFDTELLLSADKCIYWHKEQTLIISDLHFGKSGHFRKSGIGIPQAVFKEDLQRFVSLLQYFKPAQVIVIGDMFHSHDNKEHDLFLKWRRDFMQLHLHLVRGNHDILQTNWYAHAGIQITDKRLDVASFSFVHDMADVTAEKENYFFSGHIHPGISISGMGRQSLRFPCFYFTQRYAVLPAFGKFTGTAAVKPKKGDTVYAVMPSLHGKNETQGLVKMY